MNDRVLFRNKIKHCLIFLAFLQFAIYYSVNAQISDDFSDGNFSDNLSWSGDNSKFIINADGQLQLNAPAEAGQSYLSTASEIINNAEWNFFVKLQFNPSSNNYLDIYLISDVEDLAGQIDGYFVRIGNTQDEVSLYRQSGDKSTAEKIIDGMDDRVDVSQVELNIKVTKDNEDTWELFVDTTLSQAYVSEGKAMDSNHIFSRYFGLYCNYTSTRSDKFFFDNLSINGEAFSDDEAPRIDSLIVLSDSTIQLLFNEKMDISSVSNSDNYFVNNGIGSPDHIDISSDSSVIVFFNEQFNDAIENQFSIDGLLDLFGNSLTNLVLDFTYFEPYVIGFGDVIITEIMADPTPGVDLPEYEYLEIHNPHVEIFELEKVLLIVGQDTTLIPHLVIEPFEYIILCQHAAVEHFETLGRTMKVTNWPSLNNRGEQIILLNLEHNVINSVYYEDTWYKSIAKDDGGYSLELIDTSFPCRGEENWMASHDPSGGTPGKKNSVTAEFNDLSPPEIEKIIATSNTKVSIYLNENIGPKDISLDDITLHPIVGIDNIELASPGFSEIRLGFDQNISANTRYELTISNLADCAGNIQKETTSSFVLPEKSDSLDLIINEILFNPWLDGVDFVEIYNQSEKFIDFKSISLHQDSFVPISEEHFIIEPKQFIAVTQDPIILKNHYPGIDEKNIYRTSNMPALNNDEGTVVLKDIDGNQLDLVNYREDYHSNFLNDNEGVSLERISYEGASNNQNNWQSAASTSGYATPGKINSQYLQSGNENEEIIIDPKVFSPGNNGFHDFTTIKCRFASAGYMANIQILDVTGKQIKTIVSHKSIGAVEDFKWEGLNDMGQQVRIGPYIVYVEIYNSTGTKKLYRKKVVVGGQL